MPTEGINYLLLIASLLAIVIVAATFLVALSNNTAVGQRVRTRLIERLRQAPLYRMLKVRHVDVARYESETPLESMEDQLEFCDTCAHKQQCEKMLHDPSNAEADYAFCPNTLVVKQFAHRDNTE
jgi:hypothetical protein